MKRFDVRGLAALFLACTAALGGAAPANAGAPAELSCPAETLTTEDRATLIALLVEGTGDVATAQRAGARAIGVCGERFGWSAEERDAANHYMASSLMKAHHRRGLEAGGVDVAWLEREILGDEGLIRAAAEMQDNPPELHAFALRVNARLTPRQRNDGALLEHIGAFAFATAHAEDARRRFAAL